MASDGAPRKCATSRTVLNRADSTNRHAADLRTLSQMITHFQVNAGNSMCILRATDFGGLPVFSD